MTHRRAGPTIVTRVDPPNAGSSPTFLEHCRWVLITVQPRLSRIALHRLRSSGRGSAPVDRQLGRVPSSLRALDVLSRLRVPTTADGDRGDVVGSPACRSCGKGVGIAGPRNPQHCRRARERTGCRRYTRDRPRPAVRVTPQRSDPTSQDSRPPQTRRPSRLGGPARWPGSPDQRLRRGPPGRHQEASS